MFRTTSTILRCAILFATVCDPGTMIASQQPPRKPGQPTAPAAAPADSLGDDYTIGPDDVLGVVFWREPDLSGDVTVRPDGRITLPVIGELTAAGLRPDRLQELIGTAAARYLTNPNVAVVVRTINSRRVFVTGQVTSPGPHPLKGPLTVMQALAMAGGVTEFANKKNITILRQGTSGTQTFKFNYQDVARGKKLEQNIQLLPGDTIVVP